MARQVGDLWPHGSGTASLGVEQLDGPEAGFTNEIRPFNHIHMNSGVWHDPLVGNSGVVRFGGRDTGTVLQTLGSLDVPSFQLSVDGGLTFPLWVGADNNLAQSVVIQSRAGRSLQLKASGAFECIGETTSALRTINGALLIDANSPTPGAGNVQIAADDDVTIDANGRITADAQEDVRIRDTLDVTQSTKGVAIESRTDDIVLRAAEFTGGANGQGGQIQLNPFDGSGVLEYRFGPHQSWYMKRTHSSTSGPFGDGFEPLVPSGSIIQMILENAGGGAHSMQAAYDGGPRATATNPDGPVHFDGDTTYALRLEVSEDDHPHIIMSGVSEPPSNGLDLVGGVWMQNSTAGYEGQAGAAAPVGSREEAAAKSLGIDTLFMRTGSGVINLRVGSGVAQFFNIGASQAIDENGLNIPVSIETTPDLFFHINTASGIRFMVPGKYKISYTAVVEKTQGNLAQGIHTQLQLGDRYGQTFHLLGSDSYAIVRDSNALNLNTANGQYMGDFDEGDALRLFVETTEAPPADNSVRMLQRASNVIVEFISPRGANKLTRSKIS